jgi:hypothetical protein
MVISKPPIKRTQGLPASRTIDQIKSSTKFKGLPDNHGILLLRERNVLCQSEYKTKAVK